MKLREIKCELCGRIIKHLPSMGQHLKHKHNGMHIKDYYDKFVKKEDEGICKVCGKPTDYISFSYRQYCCNRCTSIGNARTAKQHCLEKYGVTHHMKLDSIKNKIKETNTLRYGATCAMHSKEIAEKVKQTMLKRYGTEYSTQNAEIKNKIKQTNLEKYGATCNLHGKEAEQQIKKNNLEKYGVEHSWQRADVKEKIQHTCLAKYGVKHALQSETIKDKIRKTCNAKYKTNWPTQAENVKEKVKRTNLQHYGVEYPMQCPEIRRKGQSKYTYNELNFDSSYELAFYIWLVDHNVKFEYHPDVSFEYEFDGIKHNYMPDFKVEDNCVEIKRISFL